MITLFEYFENVEKVDFLNDCKTIISELKEIYPKKEDFNFLYRGFKGDVSPSGSKFKTNKERKPKDTSEGLHKLADKAFLEIFGWKARSQGVFVYPNKANCKQYGITYLCFPIGNFRFVHSEGIPDLTPYLTNIYEDLETEAIKEYEDLYGEGRDGSWFYEDRIDTHENNIDYAIQDVCDDYKSYGVNVKEDFDEEVDDIRDYVNDYDFEWEPKVTESDFIDIYIDDRLYEYIYDTIQTQYQEDYLELAMSEYDYEYSEIMFDCDYYYLFPVEMEEEIKDLIYDNRV